MNMLSLILSATALFVAPTFAPAAATAAPQPLADIESSSVQIQTTGNVTFDLQSEQIFDLHGDGTLRVSELNHGQLRQLWAQGSQVVYQVNGVNAPYDNAARSWLRQVLSSAPPPPPPPPPPAP